MSETSAAAPPFPVALKLVGRRCLVVGQGSEAAARAAALLDAGATVDVIHPSPGSEVQALQFRTERLSIERRQWLVGDLQNCWLAVLTDRDPEVASRLAEECEARGLFFCAVDQPKYGSFAHVALARAGALFAAVGSNGRAPALARRLREVLQELFDAAKLGEYVEHVAALREKTPSAERARVLGAAVGGVRIEGKLVLPDAE
jgi:precorrin-2 dehydrogenase / sirohydrochlorin ferrochelatase